MHPPQEGPIDASQSRIGPVVSRQSTEHVTMSRNLAGFDLDVALDTIVVSDAQISPDATRLAYVTAPAFTTRDAPISTTIWVLERGDASGPRALSHTGSSFGPRWSPDGNRLAFVAEVEPDRFAVMCAEGDDLVGQDLSALPAVREAVEAQHNVELTSDADAPAWSPSGSKLGIRSLVPGEAPPRATIRVIDLKNPGWIELETGFHVWEFSWLSEGELLAVASRDPTEADWYDAALYRVDVESGRATCVYEPDAAVAHDGRSVRRQIARPIASPEGTSLACISAILSDRGLIGGDLLIGDGRKWRNVTSHLPISVSWAEWLTETTLLIAAWYSGRQTVATLGLDGSFTPRWTGEQAMADRYQPRFSLAQGGLIASVLEAPGRPREVYTLDAAEDEWRQETRIQAPAPTYSYETVHWTHAEMRLHGIVLVPDQSEDPPPLVVFAHGGPMFLHQYLHHGWVEGPYGIPLAALAAAGLAVFLPNPRGSFGWGRNFAEALVRNHGTADLQDIEAGIDEVIRLGLADRDRVGIGGWSSAGYLAAVAAYSSDRFKAIFVGAGISDWRLHHAGRSDVWNIDRFLIPGDPYEMGGPHDQRSPVLHTDRIQAPVLIMHGAHDRTLPVEHAYSLHRSLLDHGRSSELVIYENEAHAIRGRANQVDATHRIITFFQAHL